MKVDLKKLKVNFDNHIIEWDHGVGCYSCDDLEIEAGEFLIIYDLKDFTVYPNATHVSLENVRITKDYDPVEVDNYDEVGIELEKEYLSYSY